MSLVDDIKDPWSFSSDVDVMYAVPCARAVVSIYGISLYSGYVGIVALV